MAAQGGLRTGVQGWGINDAPYKVATYKPRWFCPFYDRWGTMLLRCLNDDVGGHVYKDSSVLDDFRRFMDFRKWAETQGINDLNIRSVQIDKDILIPGNKDYGIKGCTFVPKFVNTILLSGVAVKKSGLPIGTCFHHNTYEVNVRIDGRLKYLGASKDPLVAHKLWQIGKAEQIERMAEKYRVHAHEHEYLFRKDLQESLLNRAVMLRDDVANNRETLKLI